MPDSEKSGLFRVNISVRVSWLYINHNNNNPVSTIPPQRVVVWEFVAATYGYEEIGMKCAVISQSNIINNEPRSAFCLFIILSRFLHQ